MNKKAEEKLSKLMSFILRHKPEQFGLTLAKDGSCAIDELLVAINAQPNWSKATTDNIYQVVKNCPKQRYTIEGDRIRANYGHSSTKVQYEEKVPPEFLLHGTNEKVINVILKDGLKSMGREYVHMSESKEFATLAGKRRGELVIIKVDSKAAYEDGIKFFYAGNEVWLSNYIPSKYLSREEN